MRRVLAPSGRLALAAIAALTCSLSAAPQAFAFERVGKWSFGGWYGAGVPSASDANHQVALANLALSSDIPPFETMHEAMGDVRRELSHVLAFEGRGGYWWKTRGEGFFKRSISAIPIQAGLVFSPFNTQRFRGGATGTLGLLMDASLTGNDPVGGVNFSGTGFAAEAGVVLEMSLSQAWALQGRTVARYAVARGVLPDDGDLDFSGISGTLGLRVSFATKAAAGETPPAKDQ